MRCRKIMMYAMVWVCLLAAPVQALEFQAAGGLGAEKSASPQWTERGAMTAAVNGWDHD